MKPQRFKVELMVDADTFSERSVKQELGWALGMVLSDRDEYELCMRNVCKIKVQKYVQAK